MNGWTIIILVGLVAQIGGVVGFLMKTKLLHHTTRISPKEIRYQDKETGEVLYSITLNSVNEADYKLVPRETANTIEKDWKGK